MDILKLFFPKRITSTFKIYQNVSITDEKYYKLLKMYNFDYLNHREVDYYVSENLHVKLKSTKNLITANFRSKRHYIHIADHLPK